MISLFGTGLPELESPWGENKILDQLIDSSIFSLGISNDMRSVQPDGFSRPP